MVTISEIEWCKKQKKGIKLIEPNENLCREYIENSQETLDVLKSIDNKSRMWLATTKYYCEYFAVYSLLMRMGIKCEIHDCTISVLRLIEDLKITPKGLADILEKDKELRIDNQYYLKNREVDIDHDVLLEFVLIFKDIATRITNRQIMDIRQKLK